MQYVVHPDRMPCKTSADLKIVCPARTTTDARVWAQLIVGTLHDTLGVCDEATVSL